MTATTNPSGDSQTIQEIRQKTLDKNLTQLKKGLGIEDWTAFDDFVQEKKATGCGSVASITCYAYALIKLIEHYPNKPLKSLTKAELIVFFNSLADKNSPIKSNSSRKTIKIHVKAFLKALHKGENKEIYEWIKDETKDEPIKPEHILTEEDVRKLIDACDNDRDKCIVAMLYESGCRISEFIAVRLKDVEFGDITKIIVDGKTGRRKIPLIMSEPYLRILFENHPFKNDAESPLFTRKYRNNGMMSIHAVTDMLKRVAKRSGIKKRVNPHSFRHARATKLTEIYNEPLLRKFFGWSNGSPMPSVYCHISMQQLEEPLKELYGLKKREEYRRVKALEPKTCTRCNTKNSATRRFCVKCETALDLQTALTFDEQQKAIIKSLTRAIIQNMKENPKAIENWAINGEEYSPF